MSSSYFLGSGELFPFICLLLLHSAEPNVSSEPVKCICYNSDFMECTWSHSDGEPNYTMHYWYASEPAQECGSYIQQDGYNIGCNFTKDKIREFVNFHVNRIGIIGSERVIPPNQTFQLQDQVKPNPPTNLTVNTTTNNGISLSWEPPMIQHCLQYEIKYKSNKDKDWQIESLQEQTKFPVPSVDPKKLYTFKVRAKINDFCGTTLFWSEWSSSVTWGNLDATETPGDTRLQMCITLIPGLIILALILLVLILKNEKLKVIIIPKIPNPGRRFDSLFDNFGGNFQDWLGVPKDTLEGFKPIYHENACLVSEPPPYSKEDTQQRGLWQHLERPVFLGKDTVPSNGGGVQPETLFIDVVRLAESNSGGRECG
uniref:Cytokine receptor common subunit gamma-like n=1 Tax=Callorhinchus milii TaxID=7868 RepID=A0A4W3JRY4_CALMI|eukprot:gi/632936093/ref/XP_007892358.1/ PREDICTED: cytokine receptor common subunit gamma-like isoform X1 [Callorhinchus milii]